MIHFKSELEKLNEKQRYVVDEIDKNILLLASAGTGKTNTLALRISNIINQNRAKGEEILCLTFTNKACKEMKSRIEEIVGKDGENIKVKTFHGFCFDVIKSYVKENTDIASDFIIYDEDDCKEIIKEFNPYKFKMSSIQNFINFMKESKMILKKESYKDTLMYIAKEERVKLKNICVDENYRFNEDMIKFFMRYGHALTKKYDNTLRDRHALDFNDLLIKTQELFRNNEVVNKLRNQFKFIHIDEVQDTNKIEYEIISKLFNGNNIMLCGDYFQTIYEWRGSNPKQVLEMFKQEYSPITIVFEENYRSTKNLLNASFEYLKNTFDFQSSSIYNGEFKAKSHEEGDKIQLKTAYNVEDEGNFIFNTIKSLEVDNLSKVAVLTRNNKTNVRLSSVFERINESLPEHERIGFLLVDEFKFFRRQEIKDILAYLKVILNKFDDSNLKRILRRFVKGVGERTVEKFETKESREKGIRISDFVDRSTFECMDPYGILISELDEGNVVVFDVESTGVNTSKDEIVQIAAVKVDSNGNKLEEFERFLIPKKSVGTSENVHGFSDKYLHENGEEPEKVLMEFLDFIRGTLVVGHNVSYDLNILSSELSRLNMPQPEYIDYYDTLDISRRFYPKLKNHKLETLSRLFDTKIKSSHNALDDVLSTKDVLIKMVEDKIKPTMSARIDIYEKYLEKFIQISEELMELREMSYSLRPYELMKQIIEFSNILAIYEKEPNRIDNIKEFLNIAKEVDNEDLSPRDALGELLNITALSNSELDRMVEKEEKIPIITIHQAKGGEFDYVFLAQLQEYTFPNYQAIKEDKISEEERVFYVAMTRAKKKLFMSWSKMDGERRKNRSRFIDNIPKEFIEEV